MTRWTTAYSNSTDARAVRPVYIAMIARAHGALRTLVTASDVALEIADDFQFDALNSDPLLVYDHDHLELMTVDAWDSDHDPLFGELAVTRGQYGTFGQAFTTGACMASILAVFSTHDLGTTDLPYRTGMKMPSGFGQSMQMVSGRINTDKVSVEIVDVSRRFTRLCEGVYPVNKKVYIFGGYEGMQLRDFSMLHVGKITAVEMREGGSYVLSIDDITERIEGELFSEIDGWNDRPMTERGLSGSMTASQTTCPLDNEDYIPDTDSQFSIVHQRGDFNHYAAYYLRVDDEFMRIVRNSHAFGTCTVERGCFGTTAASHLSTKTALLSYAIEDNPIDMLLGILLSSNNSYPFPADTDAQGNYYAYNAVGDNEFGSVGLNLPSAEIDIDSFETVRDNWFADYVFRLIITEAEKMRPLIEKHLLAPLGLCLYVNREGKLALAVMRPPLDTAVYTLDESNVIGVPTIAYGDGEIVNDVVLSYNYDPWGDAYGAIAEVVDETSQLRYGAQPALEIECRGLDSGITTADVAGTGTITLNALWRGDTLAPRLARKKRRAYSDPNPTLSISTVFSNSKIEPGEVVDLSLPSLPDPVTGTIGWTKRMLVVSKRVNWATGAVDLDLVNTNYWGKKYFLISPTGTVDYTSATAADKARYGWIADTTTQKLSDGAAPYVIM